MNSYPHELQQSLPKTHIIRKLYDEHDIILSVLESLELFLSKLQVFSAGDDSATILKHVQIGADNLLAAEPHHQREEEILFPIMEEMGLGGPPSVMRMEHETLRDRKHHLKKLLSDINENNHQKYLEDITQSIDFILNFLRAHIHKENMVLYPMAFSAIQGEAIWQEMAKRSDRIGECNFKI